MLNQPGRNEPERSEETIVVIDPSQNDSVPEVRDAVTDGTNKPLTSDAIPVPSGLQIIPSDIEDVTHSQDVPVLVSAEPETVIPQNRNISATDVGMMIAWAALACLFTLINRFVESVIPLPPVDSIARHFVSLLYLAPLLIALIQTARIAVSLPLSSLFLFVTGTVLALPALSLVFITLTRIDLPIVTQFYNILPLPLQAFINNFLGPIGLSFVGAAIGRVIRHPNTLLAASGFAIFFDIVVVTMGTVKQLMSSNSNLIAAVSVGAGAPASNLPGAPTFKLPDPLSAVTIGPADVLFISLFLSSVFLLKLSWRATQIWMFGLLLLALVIVEFFALPIPALVPMGIAVLIANWKHAAFTPTEKRDLLIGGVFAVFCAVLMIIWARITIPPAPPDLGFQIGQDAQTKVIFVLRTRRDSPARKAGLRPGDELIAVNGLPMKTILEQEYLQALEKASKTGVTFQVRHRGEKKPAEVRIGPELFK